MEVCQTIMQFHQTVMYLKENRQSQFRLAHRLTPQLVEKASTAELGFAERALLRAIRRIAATHSGPVLVYPQLERLQEEVVAAVGHGLGLTLSPEAGTDAGPAAAAELDCLLRSFFCAAYRALDINSICNSSMTADERLLLSFTAACQARELDQIRYILSWIAPQVAVQPLTVCGLNLATIFDTGGMIFPQRIWLSECVGYSDAARCAGVTVSVAH
jgi:hypothetical protein